MNSLVSSLSRGEEMSKAGRTAWNKGLKAETDERVRINIERASATFRRRGYKTRLGIRHTEATKDKIRQTRLLKSYPAYWKGKHISEEAKRKISEARRGKKLDLQHRKKISSGLKKAGVTRLDKDYGFTRMNYQTWRKGVLERDKHLCQICLSDIKVLAHHLKPFKTHREIRYDVKNGISLCKACHQALHQTSLLTAKAMKTGKLQLLSQLIRALDNPVGSENSNILEPLTTNSRVLMDSNADTSVAPDNKG